MKHRTYLNSNASGARGTSDTDNFALKAEEVMERVGLGDFDRHDGG